MKQSANWIVALLLLVAGVWYGRGAFFAAIFVSEAYKNWGRKPDLTLIWLTAIAGAACVIGAGLIFIRASAGRVLGIVSLVALAGIQVLVPIQGKKGEDIWFWLGQCAVLLTLAGLVAYLHAKQRRKEAAPPATGAETERPH